MTKDEALERKAENARQLGLDYEPKPVFTYDQVKAHIQVALMSAPQRTWVGLTYEDMVKLQKDLFDAKGESVLPTTFAMAVEAKLKEKNT
jgi:hypothetical protein